MAFSFSTSRTVRASDFDTFLSKKLSVKNILIDLIDRLPDHPGDSKLTADYLEGLSKTATAFFGARVIPSVPTCFVDADPLEVWHLGDKESHW